MGCFIFHLPLQYDLGPMVWTELFVLVPMFVCVGSHVLDLENLNQIMLHLSPAASVWVVTSFTREAKKAKSENMRVICVFGD